MKKYLYFLSLCALLLKMQAHGSDWQPVSGSCGAALGEDRYYVYGSLLYWKPYGDEWDYGIVRSAFTESDGDDLFEDHIHDMKGSWDYGFRIGAEVDLLCSGWDFRTEWTHYNNKSSHGSTFEYSDSSLSTIVAIPFIVNSEDSFVSTSEKAHFRAKSRLSYDVLDFGMARWFCTSSPLSFCPSIGLRTLRVEERFSSNYSMSVSGDAAGGMMKNYFEGFGLKAGLDVSYWLPCNFTLFARSAASAIWGRAKIKHEAYIWEGSNGSIEASDLKETTREGRFIAELHAGISWSSSICEYYPLYFELCFDQTYLFNQHRFFTTVMGDIFAQSYPSYQWKKNGDLLLQGGSFTVGIEF